MTVINPNSISGITSITLPAGADNVLTIHTNDGVERFRIDSTGNIKVGSAATISPDGDLFVTGVCTATTLAGAASGLTGALPAIDGSALIGMASTENVRTGILDVAGISTFRNTMKVGAAVTISESGIEATGVGITVANINGGQIGGRRNIVINGSMQVAQRGTSSSSDGYQTVDRFKFGYGGENEAPVQYQGALTSSDTGPYGEGHRYAYYVQNGNQTGGAGSADYAEFQYKAEAQDIANCGWNYTSSSNFITLSFWVKSSVAQNFYGFVYSADGTTQRYIFETGTLTANQWKKVVVVVPGGTNVQFDNNANEGFIIKWIPFYGTDKTNNSATTGSWANYNGAARCPDYTSTWWTTDNSTFWITGVQLEVGSQATPYEHRSYGEELSLCQRYFQVLGGSNGTYDTMSTGACASSTLAYVPHRLVTSMRATPSFTLLGAASDFMYTRDGGDHNPSAIVYDQAGKNMIAVKMTGTSLNQDDATRLFNVNTNGGYLMDAEL